MHGTNGSAYGQFLELPDGFVECCERPSPDHVLAEGWATDPLDPLVCWRVKTIQEVDTEIDDRLTTDIDNIKVMKAIVIWVANLHGITPLQAKSEIKEIYRGL